MSQLGRAVSSGDNHQAAISEVHAVRFAFKAGRDEIAREILCGFGVKRIAVQIAPDGSSDGKAIDFMAPFAKTQPAPWPHEQIADVDGASLAPIFRQATLSYRASGYAQIVAQLPSTEPRVSNSPFPVRERCCPPPRPRRSHRPRMLRPRRRSRTRGRGYLCPTFETVWRIFDADQLAYGCNWPPCLNSGDYWATVILAREFFATKSPGALAKAIDHNAALFYSGLRFSALASAAR